MAEKTSIEATPAGVTVEEPGKPSAQQQQEEKTNSSGKVSQNPKPEEADEGENEDKNLTEEEEESSVEDKDDDDSAAGVVIPRRRDLRKSTRVQHDMNLVRNAMRDSYQNEGKKVLLHGYLHIHVGRAKGLRNLDCMRGCHTFLPSTIFLCLATNVSDPYVTVHAGRNRLIKTKTIFDDLNPEWNMDYYVPISHPIEHLEFRVKDWDQVSNEMIGRAFLPVSDLIQFGTDGRQLRRGVHRVVYLDGSVRNGAFEFYVEFIPKDMMHSNLVRTKGPGSNMVVPGVYFKARQQNQIKLYINADDKSEELGTPTVKYGEGLKKTWKPQRLWKDIYQTFCEAKHLIYAVGWSIDYRQSLLRGDECKNALIKRSDGKGYYSSNIGELLKQKANEGVVVNLMVWDDNTSTALMDGVIGTRDEQLRNYFSHTKVNVHLVAIAAGNAHVMKKLRQSVYYTHHQKCVIADTPSKQLVAYVGGIDLTYGRYEDGSYPLFRTLKSIHSEDFHSACFAVSQQTGPREPWHDIHNRVMGPAVLDLLQNFEERWIGQNGPPGKLVDITKAGLSATANIDDKESWSTQLFRSIDSRTAKLKVASDVKSIDFDDITGVEFEGEGKEQGGRKRERIMQKFLKSGKEYERTFKASTMDGFEFVRNLHLKREVQIDDSVHKGLVHHIRNAEHSLYIESQYLLGSSFLWSDYKTSKCCNLIASEITWKVCEKIEAGERFAAYIVVPMWPEGIPDSGSVQDILFFQYQTMQSMYTRVDAAIKRRKESLKVAGKDELEGVGPTDYLNFYSLATRETEEDGDDIEATMNDPGAKGVLNRTRRHPVYCHSKMTIVDDAIAIIGSANINQRSLAGNRDSELLLGAWQPAYLASKESVAQGDVHAFRMHCFAHLTGVMEGCYRKPSSLECVRRVNEIALKNWDSYVQQECCDMKSYLIPYPIKILEGGKLAPLTSNGKFPDTNANIFGSKPTLPEYLTT